MLRSFLLELRHLSLDHPRIDPVAPYLVIRALLLHLPQQPPIPLLEPSRGRAVTFRQPALEDLEAPQEREPIRVEPRRPGRLEHQRPDHEMPQRHRVDLLDHTGWRLAPQVRRLGRSPRVLVGLLLVEDQLLLPSLMVQDDQFFGRIEILIKQIRDQGVDFAMADPLRIVQRVADHPHDDPTSILPAVVGRSIDLGQIRAIGQVADRLEDQPAGHPRQDLHATRGYLLPQAIAEEAAVPQQAQLRRPVAEQAGDHRLLTMGRGPYHEGDLDVRPQLDRAELADLGEGPAAARPGRGAAEGSGVGVRVGDIADHAIDPHQTEPAVEGPGRLGPGRRANDPLEQVAHWGDAQALPGHAEAGPVRRLLTDPESACVLEDLADGQIGQQPHRQGHPADDLVGQFATSLIGSAGRLKGLANGLGWDHLFESRQAIQDPARVSGRQRAMSLWHSRHGLLVAWVLSKPKVRGGCDLRLFQRYWDRGYYVHGTLPR